MAKGATLPSPRFSLDNFLEPRQSRTFLICGSQQELSANSICTPESVILWQKMSSFIKTSEGFENVQEHLVSNPNVKYAPQMLSSAERLRTTFYNQLLNHFSYLNLRLATILDNNHVM